MRKVISRRSTLLAPFKKIFHRYTFITFVLAFIFSFSANGTTHHTKFWSVGTFIGSFSNADNFKYYLEPQIRFIDDRYKFNQLLFLGGVGYQVNPDVMVFGGPGWILSKNPDGTVFHEYRLWEQIMWNALNTTQWSLNSRTRLEERKNTSESQIAYRLRERLWARVPIKAWEGHSFSLFDEVFFNLNNPKWTSPDFFEQNRAFIGVGTQLSKTAILDIGYLNQLQLGRTTAINNVFLVSLTVVS